MKRHPYILSVMATVARNVMTAVTTMTPSELLSVATSGLSPRWLTSITSVFLLSYSHLKNLEEGNASETNMYKAESGVVQCMLESHRITIEVEPTYGPQQRGYPYIDPLSHGSAGQEA